MLYLTYLVWEKGNITKLKRVGKHQFVTKQSLKKEREDFNKREKVNQER